MKINFKNISTALVLMIASYAVNAATITSATTGQYENWSSPAAWAGGQVPRPGDDVIIDHGDRIMMDVPVTCRTLFLDNGSRLCLKAALTTSTLFLDNGSRLYGACNDINLTNLINSTAILTIMNGARMLPNRTCDDAGSCSGGFNFSVNGNISINDCDFVYNNLTITNGTFSSTCNITVNGALTLNAGGEFTTTGTMTYGPNAKLVLNRSYVLTGSRKVWASGTGTNVPPTVEILSGTIQTNDTLTVKRRINLMGGTLGTGAVTKIKLANNDTVFKCGGAFASTPKFGTNVTMLYCAPQPGNPPAVLGAEMPATGFTGDVIISTNLVLGANLKVPAGKVVVTSTGVLNDSNFNITEATQVQVQSGGVIRTQKPNGLTGTNSLFGSLPLTLGAGTTVEYYASTGSQNISPLSDYGSILFSNTADKVFPAGTTTTILGNVTNTGTGTISGATGSTVNFTGGDQHLAGMNFQDVNFGGTGTKFLDGATTIAANMNIFVNTSVTVQTNDNLTLLSGPAGTAQVGPLLNGADIIGNVCWHRFIPGGPKNRRWRFLSNPIKNVTFRWWQNDMHITGPGANGVACAYNTTSNSSMVQNSNGFDQNHTGLTNPKDTAVYSTVFTYNETLGAWKTIASTFDTINPLVAYRTFVRGNRNIEGCQLLTAMPMSVSDVTLKSCGPIVKFTQTIPLSFTAGKGNGWNYVSNPYPCSINWWDPQWVAQRSTTISPTIYIWDPVNAQYATWNPLAGGTNGACHIIGTGQSFFVQTSAPTNLVFQESYKLDSGQIGFFGKTSVSPVNQNRLAISLKTGAVTDQAIVYMYNGATLGYEPSLDGYKMGFSANSIATSTRANAELLTFSAIPHTLTADTIQLHTSLAAATSYTLSFSGLRTFDAKYSMLVIDKYTNTVVNLGSTNTYSFSTVAGVPASTDPKRFELIITNASSLPVTLVDFKASANEAQTVDVAWATAQEVNNSHFIVMHSSNGTDFSAIGQVKGHGNSAAVNSYTLKHATPVKGANYYKLQQVDLDGTIHESYTVVVNMNVPVQKAVLSVFPVPATDVLNISSGSADVAVASASVYDVTGKKLSETAFTRNAQQAVLQVSTLNRGSYFISVKLSDGSEQKARFIKQ